MPEPQDMPDVRDGTPSQAAEGVLSTLFFQAYANPSNLYFYASDCVAHITDDINPTSKAFEIKYLLLVDGYAQNSIHYSVRRHKFLYGTTTDTYVGSPSRLPA